MATSITIQKGTVTETSIQVRFKCTATYAANYYVRYGCYETSATRTSGTFAMSANGSYTTSYSSFTGLDSGETYTFWCSLYNADNGNELGITDELEVTTLSSDETYYARVTLNGNGGKYGSSTTRSFTDSDTSSNSYCYINIDFVGSGFTRAGYTLDGWYDENISNFYDVDDTVRVRATSTSSSSPTTVNLYANWIENKSTVDVVNASSDDQDVTVAVGFTAGIATTYKLIFSLQQDGEDIYTHTSSNFSMNAGGYKSVSYTFTDVDYGEYDVYVILVYSSSPTSGLDYGMDTITVTPPRPSAWSWSGKVTFGGKTYNCPITSGGEVPYYYNATDDVYQVYFMGATEWNNFCTQVNLLRNYHGLSNYNFSKATAGYQMQASQFNQAVAALNGIRSGSVSQVVAGGTISASSFNSLATAFNNLR